MSRNRKISSLLILGVAYFMVASSGLKSIEKIIVYRVQGIRSGSGPQRPYRTRGKKTGFEPIAVTIKSRSRAHAHPGAQTIWVHLVGDRQTDRLLGAVMVGPERVAHRINAIAVALHANMSVATFAQTDLAYAPPFSPVWDPMLTAANQLLKKR
jgi:NADPH-dependent 2,4-dienoyl-CoA reductase/sulfur reductase-like enzyme